MNKQFPLGQMKLGSLSALSFPSFAKFSVKEQTQFAKRMSFLVKAGVPLIESLHLIRKQTSSKAKAKVLDSVIEDVNNGQFLATSLEKHPKFFGEFAVNLIRVGEQSGILSQNLSYLADELQKKDALKRKVLGALVYPVVITLATLGITGVLTMYVFPKILPIFTSMHAALPASTRILIAITNFLTKYGGWLLLAIVVCVVGLSVLVKKVSVVKYYAHYTLLHLPLFGQMAQDYNLANFTRTLGLLLKSGVQLTDAMVMIEETTPNLVYKKAYKRVVKSVLHGEPMSRQLGRDGGAFPDMMVHMLAIGETTGSLSGTLIYLSELYEAEVEEMTKNLSSAIEPFLMVFMGLLVGFIAVSIITPIYAITQNLHG